MGGPRNGISEELPRDSCKRLRVATRVPPRSPPSGPSRGRRFSAGEFQGEISRNYSSPLASFTTTRRRSGPGSRKTRRCMKYHRASPVGKSSGFATGSKNPLAVAPPRGFAQCRVFVRDGQPRLSPDGSPRLAAGNQIAPARDVLGFDSLDTQVSSFAFISFRLQLRLRSESRHLGRGVFSSRTKSACGGHFSPD